MMLTNTCPGVRLEATSVPSACSLTWSMNCLTTGRATSASSSATRTSRSTSATLASVMRPRPRSVSTVRLSRDVRLSNIRPLYGMTDARTGLLLLLLVGLLITFACSSGTEVAMLSVNRYRLRHRAKSGQRAARLLEKLLQRPDDWLGVNLVILAAASVFASQAATIIAQRTHFHFALPLTGIILTIVMIVFGELAPKIFGATHSESVALSSAYIYRALVVSARPVLWLTSRTAYSFLRVFGVVRSSRAAHGLSTEELRMVVAEAGSMIPARHRQMLLSILD